MYLATHSEAFPASARYRALTAPAASRVRESGAFPWTERHLRCIWYDARYRPPILMTSDGQQVNVLDPGRWNLEAGPDFRDATLTVMPGTRQLRGDVELHVRCTDWETHGHRTDPRYRRLIAHVSWLPGSLPADTLPPGTLQMALQPVFKAGRSFAFDTLDVTAYPYAALEPDPPCRQPWRLRTPDEQAAILQSAGEERLRRKAERLAQEIEARGAVQVFYEEAMAALGYKYNRQPFREMAERLPVAMLREVSGNDPLHAYAVLCGVSGLLPGQAAAGWDGATRAFMRTLWDLWWKHAAAWAGRTLSRHEWTLANGRPANHPLRRLMAAAEWFASPVGIGDRLLELPDRDPERFAKAALTMLEDTGRTTFWATRQGLSGKPLPQPLALVGAGRAAAMMNNVVVPWLAAQGSDRLTAALAPLLPAEDDNQVVRHTAHALFGHDHNPSLYRAGIRQQGLLQVFHDFCINARGGCESCRFAEALRGP